MNTTENCSIAEANFHFDINEQANRNMEVYSELWPLFLSLVALEYIALRLKGKAPRLGESLNSLGHGIMAESVRILTLGMQITVYASVHSHCKIFDFSWTSSFAWIFSFFLVDLAYYIGHRATHEINFLWAQHHIHHSSEDFNLAVSVRHPISHSWINTFFYLPLAILIPPTQVLVYQEFNLIYQAWIHTSLIGDLGPLVEYFLNTPSHHKVHHGCNLYALDKNFGGILIIWDRLFGTFESLRPNEDLIFGIVFQHKSFNPFWQMWHKFASMWSRVKGQKSFIDSLKVIFYGPSWIAGVEAPRLGRLQDKVTVKPRPKFEVPLPPWLQVYLVIHFLVVAVVFQDLATKGNKSELSLTLTLAFFVFTLATIGFLSERNLWGPRLEPVRCLCCFVLAPASFQPYASLLFSFSSITWIGLLLVPMEKLNLRLTD